ncbi:MAG: beta-lactamase family protein, partial [Alcanivoracaceae bacterium]|nr:beta-lactamase family protein [Alcanivoracaceae bacterium]
MILPINFKFLKHNAKKHLATVVLLCAFSLSCFAKENQINNLIKQIELIRVNNHISGAVVLLLDKQNTLINQRLGTSSWQNSQAMSADQMFRIGSISKSFAALLALRMQQKGLIDLKKSMRHYTKKQHINNCYADTEISLEQLLEHTAGLADLSKAEWDYNDSKPISIEQALSLRKDQHKTRWQPGLHSSYSNVGAGMLGLALEKATSEQGDVKSYEQLMDKYVFIPLGMKSSSLLLTGKVKSRLMTGYNTDGKTVIPYWHNIYRPFAAINTDTADIIQFLQMLLNKGTVNGQHFLSPAALVRMETPQTSLAAQSGLQYGYGLANYSWQFEGHTFHGHGGDA